MVEEYLPLVHKIANKLVKRLPLNTPVQDLINEGVFGLMEAVKRFNPKRQVSFPGFAYLRIKGAMIDGLREYSWMPRLSLRRISKYREAVSSLRQKLERDPTTHEIARGMRTTQKMVEKIKMQEYIAYVPEEVQMRAGEEGDTLMSLTRDRRARNPWETACSRDQMQKLMSRFSLRDRQICTLYFINDFTLKKIGEILHLSESRTSQLAARIKRRLGQVTSLSA